MNTRSVKLDTAFIRFMSDKISKHAATKIESYVCTKVMQNLEHIQNQLPRR